MNFFRKHTLTLFVAAGLFAAPVASAVDLAKAKIVRADRTIAEFDIEIADNEAAREQGLAGREYLDERRAMLFLLKRSATTSFWMKGMRFPIDLLLFDKEGELIGILPMLQPCDADCPIYPAPPDAAYAMEVKGGTAQRIELALGDRISILSVEQ